MSHHFVHRVWIGSPATDRNASANDLWVDTSARKIKWCVSDNPETWVVVAELCVGGSGSAVAWGAIEGALSAQADLQSALNAKAAASHGHAISDVTNLTTELQGKAAAAHAHAIENITGLVAALLGKADAVHLHDATYEAKNANIQAHIASAHAPSNAQKNSDITKAEIESKLTGEIASHTHAASDPWTYVRVQTDFTTSSAAAVDVIANNPALLAFTPQANQRYEFEANLMVRTATAAVGPRPGVAWPTGGSDGVAQIRCTSAAGTEVMQNGNISAAVLGPVGGLPTTNGSWPAFVWGNFFAGASPVGALRIQMASETAGTVVTVKAGSYLKYRAVP